MKKKIVINNAVISQKVRFGSNNNTKLKLTVDLCDIPKDIPTKVNPRPQNMRTKISKAIVASIQQRNPLFEAMNNGIKIIADDVMIRGQNVIIVFDDSKSQGVLNGGHTYRAVLENVGEDYPRGIRVDVDIMCGPDVEREAVNIAIAQNSSVSLKQDSILNANGVYDLVKEVISGQEYADKVCYTENRKNMISVNILLALCWMMDTKRFTSYNHPCDAYNSKTHAGGWYEGLINNDPDYFIAITHHIPEFVALYEYIQSNIKEWYDAGSTRVYANRSINGGRKCTLLTGKKLEKRVPDAYVYPIFAALRAALRVDENNKFSWVVNPYTLLSEIGQKLTVEHLTHYSAAANGADFMKRETNWMYLYNIVHEHIQKSL